MARDHAAEWARRNELARERGHANAAAERRAKAGARDHVAERQRRDELARDRGYRNLSDQRRRRAALDPAPRDQRQPRRYRVGSRDVVTVDRPKPGRQLDRAVERGIPGGPTSATVTVQTSGGPRTVEVDIDDDGDWYDGAVAELEDSYGGSWSGAVVASVTFR